LVQDLAPPICPTIQGGECSNFTNDGICGLAARPAPTRSVGDDTDHAAIAIDDLYAILASVAMRDSDRGRLET